MTGKDVWRWILTKFDNDVILQIHKKKKVVCNGFRTNTIQDISANRNRLITNLLNKSNYKKLVLWAAENPPPEFKKLTLVDKEMNELVDIAAEGGVPDVLIKLFCESQERKAIQFFAFLQDEHSSLLEFPNQSIRVDEKVEPQLIEKKHEEKEVDEKSQEPGQPKGDGKKVQKLAKKLENLTEVLKKRDENYKTKMEDLEKSHRQTIQKLDEKNNLYGTLLKEKEALEKRYREEKNKWELERKQFEETIAHFQKEVTQLKATIHNELEVNVLNDDEINKYQIMVIGKPAFMTHFQSETINFTFIEGNDVHDFSFTEDFDEYWVLSYVLSNPEQFLLKYNDSYTNLNPEKVYICKDFNVVKRQIKKYNRLEERVF